MDVAFFDLGIHDPGQGVEAAYDAISTAKFAERVGYSRYWIGEHHNPYTAWRSPEILIGLIAGYTNLIRIGSAGMLMRYHNALLVAQNFKMLNDLFPDRIDLGFAKGAVSELIKNHLVGSGSINEFDENVLKTKAILEESEEIPFLLTEATNSNLSEFWVLGSSLDTLRFAVDNGLNCCLSLCHSLNSLKKITEQLDDYRNYRFKSNKIKSKIGFLIAGVANDSKSKLKKIHERSIYTGTLKLNFESSTVEAENFLKNIISLFNPDLIAFGNIYRSKQVKLEHLKYFINAVEKIV